MNQQIFFFDTFHLDKSRPIQLSTPRLNTRIREDLKELYHATKAFPNICAGSPHPLLFRLGLLFLETAYSADLGNSEVESSLLARWLEYICRFFFTQEVLPNSAIMGCQGAYDEAVEKPIRCKVWLRERSFEAGLRCGISSWHREFFGRGRRAASNVEAWWIRHD